MQTKFVFPLLFVTQDEPGMTTRETITTTDADGNVTMEVLDFTYDASGSPYTLTYTNGTASPVTYYYVVNLQGDVMRLVSASGATVAEYWYGPYGEVQMASGAMAEVNPLRYRGYYYDAESEFYYLQSRYYDPAVCRFVNADAYASTGQGFLGQNMFAYCMNSPYNYADNSGFAAGSLTLTTVHNDGAIRRSFQTLDDAAYVAAKNVRLFTDADNLEHGYVIYRVAESGSVRYYLGKNITGSHNELDYTDNILGGKDGFDPGLVVGAVHSHPNCTSPNHPGDRFSIQDSNGVDLPDWNFVKTTGIPLYLATTNGKLLKLTRQETMFVGHYTHRVETIRSDLPVSSIEYVCGNVVTS